MKISIDPDRLFNAALNLFLFVSLFFYWAGVWPLYGIQEIFIQYGIMAIFFLSLFVPRKRETSNAFFAAIMIYALLNTLLFHFQDGARLKLLNFFLAGVFIKTVSERVDLSLKSLGKALTWFCILNIVWMIFQKLNIDPLYSPVEPQKKATIEMVGLMGSQYALGVVASLMAPIIACFSWFAVLGVIPLLIAGHSSTAMFAFACSMLFIMYFKNKLLFKISVLAVVTAVVVYVFCFDMPTGQFLKRFKIWHFGLQNFFGSNIWAGRGLNSWFETGFMMRKGNGEPEWWSWAHNDWLQHLFEQGIIGFSILILYFKNAIKRFNFRDHFQLMAGAAVLALCICAFFHFPFRVGRLAGMSLFIIALLEAHTARIIE